MKPSTPPLPSEEDEALIRDYLLYNLLQSLLKRDIQILKTLSLKMADLYILNLQYMQKGNSDHAWSVQQQMRQRGIRIQNQSRTAEDGVQVLYLCRGYERRLLSDWASLKEAIKEQLVSYLGTDLAAY
ncbi:hypothetical protein PVOR_12705 [Paenibacillus vortex V453]|jgi:hypothetical protein|uniref:Uncharacterized protein n=2 Tax=Paenibacillus TaxID=44249 RepID=A0A163LA44_9BACL|nr:MULTISPECIES: hypothetical protein [Paenibacillus]ANA81895.1 hypothetical protein A3958_18840 [Paenibacillus glucanolyticus]AVV59372.1 hypothetical protein C7121_26210 [Paenibacillus glucanolyticus]EFU41787.1 hypothetical protein PVOR_12705 [Paenibacillus vortex V453]ETT43320.1 hypothetical protein C169_01255 [Paenibacillus sp. FSL R5-808]KZS47935.1 hypothetical protein AWU65_19430 [Paenibacillus glucanolyticus]